MARQTQAPVGQFKGFNTKPRLMVALSARPSVAALWGDVPLGLCGRQPEMVQRPLRLVADPRIPVRQKGGECWNRGFGSGTLQTQGARRVPTHEWVGIAQLLHQLQNQQIGLRGHLDLRPSWRGEPNRADLSCCYRPSQGGNFCPTHGCGKQGMVGKRRSMHSLRR